RRSVWQVSRFRTRFGPICDAMVCSTSARRYRAFRHEARRRSTPQRPVHRHAVNTVANNTTGRHIDMELKNKVAVITGGAGGIGKAMARAFLDEGAKAIMLADLDAAQVERAARDIGCDGMACDVTNEAHVVALVERTRARHGEIDLFCSNA